MPATVQEDAQQGASRRFPRPMLPHEDPNDDMSPLKIETEQEFDRVFSIADEISQSISLNPKNAFQLCKQRCFNKEALSSRLRRRFPIINWAPKVDMKNDFLIDIAAGVSLGCIIAPKAMGHALLATLPPINGVYTAFFAALFYGIMGTSVWLSTGTGALPSMLFAVSLSQITSNSDEAAAIAPMLTFYVGLFTLLIGLCRVDKLMCLVSPAALSAFTVGAAFLIFTSQLKYFTGLHISPVSTGVFVDTFILLFENIDSWNWVTFGLGICSVTFLLLFKEIFEKAKFPLDPSALILVIFSTLASSLLDLESYGVAIVGVQKTGFPQPMFPWDSAAGKHGILIGQAFPLAFINFILMLSVSSAMAQKSNTKIDQQQEVMTLGTINTVGSFFQTFIATASFSGSAILSSYKAHTLLTNFSNALILLLIMTLLGDVIAYLPRVTLSSIIVVALPRLVDFTSVRRLARVKMEDAIVWVLTFLITLFTSIQIGIYSGIGLSVLLLAWRSICGGGFLTEVGRLPRTVIYRSLTRFPNAQRVHRNLRILRIDTSINFANREHIEKKLTNYILSNGHEFNVLIISCEAINNIDTAALVMLEGIDAVCLEVGVRLVFAGFKMGVRDTLYRAKDEYHRAHSSEDDVDLPTILNPGRWYLNLHDAVLRTTKCLQNNVLHVIGENDDGTDSVVSESVSEVSSTHSESDYQGFVIERR